MLLEPTPSTSVLPLNLPESPIFGAKLAPGDVVNTLFNRNRTSSHDGGAVYLWEMGANQLWFTNDIFFGNHADHAGSFGGAIALGESSTTAAGNAMIVNCTFATNYVLTCPNGLALSVSPSSQCWIYNSILFSNYNVLTGNCSGVLPISGPLVAIDFSDVEGFLYPGNNLSQAPNFRSISAPSGLTLQGGGATSLLSTCIDHADFTKLPNDNLDVNGDGITTNQVMPIDMNGVGRVFDWPAAPDLGFPSTNPWLDMGAYEKR
jgi:hypothetical protein